MTLLQYCWVFHCIHCWKCLILKLFSWAKQAQFLSSVIIEFMFFFFFTFSFSLFVLAIVEQDILLYQVEWIHSTTALLTTATSVQLIDDSCWCDNSRSFKSSLSHIVFPILGQRLGLGIWLGIRLGLGLGLYQKPALIQTYWGFGLFLFSILARWKSCHQEKLRFSQNTEIHSLGTMNILSCQDVIKYQLMGLNVAQAFSMILCLQ